MTARLAKKLGASRVLRRDERGDSDAAFILFVIVFGLAFWGGGGTWAWRHWHANEEADQARLAEQQRQKLEEEDRKHTAERTADFKLRYAALSHPERTRMLSVDQRSAIAYVCQRDASCFVTLRDDVNEQAYLKPTEAATLRTARPDLFTGDREDCFAEELTIVCQKRLASERD